MIAMRLMIVRLDEYFTFGFFCRWDRDVKVVASGVLAVVDDLAPYTVQRAVVELESFFGQALFQAIESVVMQVITDTQCIRGIAILNLAVRQA